MKNHVHYFGFLLVGVCLVSGFKLPGVPNIQLPSLPTVPSILKVPQLPRIPKLPSISSPFGINPLSPKVTYDSPVIPGLPNFSISASGNAGDPFDLQNIIRSFLQDLQSSINLAAENILIQSTAQVRQALNISDDAFKSFLSNNLRLKGPSLPQLPTLPESPLSNFFGIPGEFPSVATDIISILSVFPDTQNLLSQDLLNLLGSNDTVESALTNLESQVNDLVAAVESDAKHAIASVQEYVNGINNEIDKVGQAAQTQINNSLLALGPNIKNCVDKNGNPISAAVSAAQQSAHQCVQNKVNEVLSIVNGAQSDISKAQLSVEYLRGNLSNCNLNVSLSFVDLPEYSASNPGCIASGLLSVQSDTLLIPVDLAFRAVEAIALIEGLEEYATKCAASLMADITKSSISTSLALTKCLT